jgi:hypothetical protein
MTLVQAEPEGDRKSTSQSHAHPNVLVSSEDYFLSSNNPVRALCHDATLALMVVLRRHQVAYVVSEFVDNSLMAIILNTRQLKGRIDVYILIRVRNNRTCCAPGSPATYTRARQCPRPARLS